MERLYEMICTLAHESGGGATVSKPKSRKGLRAWLSF